MKRRGFQKIFPMGSIIPQKKEEKMNTKAGTLMPQNYLE